MNLDTLLDAITVIHKFITDNAYQSDPRYRKNYLINAEEWRRFVARLFKEEDIGWEVDEKCGIHYFVDEEFQVNKLVTLTGLQNERYKNVRSYYESAFNSLDNHQDIKSKSSAVKSIFSAAESLVKLMVDTQQLNKRTVENDLKDKVLSVYSEDETATAAINKAIGGFADWVDAIHNYRHGQGEEKVVDPPLDFTIYVLNSGAAFIRWLIEIDTKLNNTKSKRAKRSPTVL